MYVQILFKLVETIVFVNQGTNINHHSKQVYKSVTVLNVINIQH